MAEYLLIPKSDIEDLERARIFFHEYFNNEGNIETMTAAHAVSMPMYQLTHRKYPVIEKD